MFSLNSIKGKRILIKTYLSESGLWYLGKSLGDLLSKNNDVWYIPKCKYASAGAGRYKRVYLEPTDPNLLSEVSHIPFSEHRTVQEQVASAARANDIDIIFSFETFMRKAQWVSSIKSNSSLKVIDIPMPEWVEGRFVDNGSYSIFDNILCLTDTSYSIFKNSPNRARCEWDYVDNNLFVPRLDKSSRKELIFYHPGSLNPKFSQKNTEEVINAFLKFKNKHNAKLIITGKLDGSCTRIAKNDKNIILITDTIGRREIVSIYDKSNCVIMPSKREGLGLSFFEAKKMGCDLITTNVDPMNIHTKYLCEVTSYKESGSQVPFAITDSSKILEQLNLYYEDYKMSKSDAKQINIKKKKKTTEEIDAENAALLAAFEDADEVSAEDPVEDGLNMDVLSKLKQKMAKKSQDEPVGGDEVEVVTRRSVSIEFAVIGVGQAGSRLAEVFYQKGYDTGVVNTSAQDLEYINVPQHQKLLLEGSLGGTGKDLDLGREIFAESTDLLGPFLDGIVEGNNMVYLTVSGGGGTGSSCVDTVIPMLFETGLPVGVIYVLPKATEDAQSKRNSIETLSRLAKLTTENMVSNLIVVDNARIEQIYADLSQSKFWDTANNAIVEPLHIFNSLTAQPSRFTSLDPSDFGRIISCGDCSIYGVMEVEDYMEETALAEAVIDSLNSNMLASGFDVSQTRAGGVIITGPSEVLERLPAININYCFHMISEQTNGASIFQGVYSVDSESDSVKIYSWFAGLGLPKDRVENLRRESQEQAAIATEKERNRGAAMTLDLGEDKVNTVAQEVNRKIQKKKSSFSRLQRGSRGSIIDRRKKR